MDEVSDLLRDLDARLAAARLPVAQALRPGAPRALIIDAVGDVPDLIAWWAWHDGADLPPPVPPVDGAVVLQRPENYLPGDWHVLSLADAVRVHDWYRRQFADLGAPDTVPASWFPLLREHEMPSELWYDRSGGGLYIIDMHADLPADPPAAMYVSMAELVRSLIAWVGNPEPGSRTAPPAG